MFINQNIHCGLTTLSIFTSWFSLVSKKKKQREREKNGQSHLIKPCILEYFAASACILCLADEQHVQQYISSAILTFADRHEVVPRVGSTSYCLISALLANLHVAYILLAFCTLLFFFSGNLHKCQLEVHNSVTFSCLLPSSLNFYQ